MNKLSLDTLKMRAEAVSTEELMANIGGGTENSCHDGGTETTPPKDDSWEFQLGAGYDEKNGFKGEIKIIYKF